MGNRVRVAVEESVFGLESLLNRVGWENVLQVLAVKESYGKSYTVIYREDNRMIEINNIFSQIKNISNLRVDKIIIDGKAPVLFTCTDLQNKVYLALCPHFDANQILWYLSETKYNTLIDLLTDKITVREAFLRDSSEKYVITYDGGDVSCELVSTEKLDTKYLPSENVYMDVEENEFREEILEFKGRMG